MKTSLSLDSPTGLYLELNLSNRWKVFLQYLWSIQSRLLIGWKMSSAWLIPVCVHVQLVNCEVIGCEVHGLKHLLQGHLLVISVLAHNPTMSLVNDCF